MTAQLFQKQIDMLTLELEKIYWKKYGTNICQVPAFLFCM
jgi:hypothetical protein